MKKLILLFLAIVICGFQLFAQFELLNTFDSNDDFVYQFDTESQTMYYFVDATTKTIHFYEEDFSFLKSLAAPVIPGFEIYINSSFEHVSTNVFNNDPLIEFSCDYLADGSGINTVFIFNENLDQLASFDSANIQSIYLTKNGEIRMNLQKYSGYMQIANTLVYLLRETTTSVNHSFLNKTGTPYPNPARKKLSIPYELKNGDFSEMKIMDANGRVIKVIAIGSHFNEIKLDVTEFEPGLYFYNYELTTGKFLVN